MLPRLALAPDPDAQQREHQDHPPAHDDQVGAVSQSRWLRHGRWHERWRSGGLRRLWHIRRCGRIRRYGRIRRHRPIRWRNRSFGRWQGSLSWDRCLGRLKCLCRHWRLRGQRRLGHLRRRCGRSRGVCWRCLCDQASVIPEGAIVIYRPFLLAPSIDGDMVGLGDGGDLELYPRIGPAPILRLDPGVLIQNRL